MIGSYNYYHLSPNGIPSGNEMWYGLVYIRKKVTLRQIRLRCVLMHKTLNLRPLYRVS